MKYSDVLKFVQKVGAPRTFGPNLKYPLPPPPPTRIFVVFFYGLL